MKIIDSHTHIMFTGWMEMKPLPRDAFISQFKSRGVEKIFVSAVDGLVHNQSSVHIESNNRLAGFMRECKGFACGFCTVNPDDGKKAAAELRRAVEELGMRGLKLHPWLQSFSITSPMLMPVMEEAAGLKIPVIFHDGTPPFSTPFQIGRLAELFPSLVIILGHGGLKDLWPNSITVAAENENVYLCTCASPFLSVRRMVEEAGADKILFGSDAGFGAPECIDYNLDKIKMLPFSETDKEKILSGTAVKIMNGTGKLQKEL